MNEKYKELFKLTFDSASNEETINTTTTNSMINYDDDVYIPLYTPRGHAKHLRLGEGVKGYLEKICSFS
jgi:hypothetical protein